MHSSFTTTTNIDNVNSILNVVKSVHTDYVITNNEWMLVNDILLSEYLDSLGIGYEWYTDINSNSKNFQPQVMLRYMGVGKFYLRSVYRHQYVHGGDCCNLDPWNREFPIFPNNGSIGDATECMKVMYDYDYFHSRLWGDAAEVYNVYVLSTSVCGNRVYCVDILK